MRHFPQSEPSRSYVPPSKVTHSMATLIRMTPVTFGVKMGSDRCTIRFVEVGYIIQHNTGTCGRCTPPRNLIGSELG